MQKESMLNILEEKIYVVRKRQNYVNLLSNILIFSLFFFLTTAFLIILEMLFDFSKSARTIIAIFYSLCFIGAFSWIIVRSFLKWIDLLPSYSDENIAKQIGKFFPHLQDRLLNALQLAASLSAKSQIYSTELTEQSLKSLVKETQSLNFTQCIDTKRIPKYRNLLIVVLTIVAIIAILFPFSFSESIYHLVYFSKDFTPPPQYLFEITPGNKEIVKGESVDIRIKVIPREHIFNQPIKELRFLSKQEEQEKYNEIKLSSDSGNIFHTTISTIRSTTEYFASIYNTESEHYFLTVLNRPLIRSFKVKLDYPSYTKLPAKIQDDFMGDIKALIGTRVIISGKASKQLKQGSIHFGNKSFIPLQVNKEEFSASFTLTSNDTYCISLIDQEGLTNIDPVHYRLVIIQDEYPTVAILQPGRNIDIAGNESLPLLLEIKDDFGFSSLRIGYKLIKSRFEPPHSDYTFVQIPISKQSVEKIEVNYFWNLKSLNLVPEDVVEYFAEVFDNDIIKGPKSGRSQTYLLRLPSLEEVFADIDKGHEKTLDDLKESLETAKKLKEDIEDINRDLKKNKNPDWQTQKKIQEMSKRYQELQKKLDEAQSRIEQIIQQSQQQNILSNETLEKYMELQQLFDQIDSAELQKMLNQIQQRMPNISKEQLQQAMQKMTFSEEIFRLSIERTIDLLKRIQIEQKIDEVKKRAKELEEAQKQLQEESSKVSSDPEKQKELEKRQSDLSKKEKALEREAKDLQQKMEEFFTEMPSDQMKKALEELQNNRVDQQMQQAAQQIQMGNFQQAQQTQQQISKHLQQFSQQMDAIQQQMLQQQAQYVMNALRKATNDMLEISKTEESLKQASKSTTSNSPQLRQNAQEQQKAIQALTNVVKELNELSKRSFAVTPEMSRAIGEALSYMNEAMRALDMRNGAYASRQQEQAMTALNKAATQIQNTLQSMMQQGGGSGMGSLMQQLRMMADYQMAINMQTMQISEIPQQQAEEAARLAQQQLAVQKSLEELNREAQQSLEGKKILGDLQKIADEMKEVAKNLGENRIDSETLRKQERILSRLLDASRSIHERDYEKKRRAETGRQITRKSPAELDFDALQGKDKLREELLKALEQKYSKDYQELIRKYFQGLEKNKELEHSE